MRKFLIRSHQCQLVMNGDLDGTLFVIWSCPFADIQFIEANVNTFTYKLISSLCISCMCVCIDSVYEREKEMWISKSDELLLLSECVWHCHAVIECIVARRSCVKWNDDCARVSSTNKRDTHTRKLVQLYTCASDGGPGNAILLEREKEGRRRWRSSRSERERREKTTMREVVEAISFAF